MPIYRPGDALFIPGLPRHIERLPAEITGSDDPDREAKVAAWLEWGEKVVEYRYERWAICEGLIPAIDAHAEQGKEIALCAHFPIYFITMYMHVYETDPDRLKLYPWYRPEHGGWLPAVPFPYLVRLINWLDDRLKSKNGLPNGIITKSRRMGATDWLINWALAHWVMDSPFSAKFISRNMSLVYDKNNMDALLQRAIAKLDDQPGNAPIPGWLMPRSWQPDEHVQEPKITRPDNRNLIGGEATTGKAGRGGRATAAVVDEAAIIGKDLRRIVGAIQATAPHVIVNSSETTEEGEDFIEMKDAALQANPEMVFEIDYWMHPFQDRKWLEAEEQRYIDNNQHMAFFREILRQPYAGEKGWMYSDMRNRDVEAEYIDIKDHEHSHIEIGIDPGHRDETAIHVVMVDNVCKMDVFLESYEAAGMPAEYFAAVLGGVDPDQYPEFHFSPTAREFMEFMRTLPKKPRRICGDPAGTQSHGGPTFTLGKPAQDNDWYSRVQRWWMDNNVEPIPIVFNWSMKTGRYLQSRRLAMMEWLRETRPDGTPRLRFNDTPQVRRTVMALKKSKWQESEKRLTEAKDTYHDEYSHRRSAAEFLAVNRSETKFTEGGRVEVKNLKVRTLEGFGNQGARA